jgi:hypothetical protein
MVSCPGFGVGLIGGELVNQGTREDGFPWLTIVLDSCRF